MELKKSSSLLKREARGLLLGKYRNAIAIILASNLIINILTLFNGSVFPSSAMELIIHYVVGFILTLISSILLVGQCAFYLNIACEREYCFDNLFEGFRVHPDKTIITQILIQLTTSIPLLPGFACLFLSYYNKDAAAGMFSLVLLIFGIVFSVWFGIIFSQTYYLLLDFPESKSLDLLKMSYKLMKGNKGRYLYLQLSFLPLFIMGILTLGIGILFVEPYQSMSNTLFYLDLIRIRYHHQES